MFLGEDDDDDDDDDGEDDDDDNGDPHDGTAHGESSREMY